MTDAFRFAVIGLGAGALYALGAIGLVLIFRGSKVVNFAQGAMGMISAYAFYEVRDQWRVSTLVAVPVAVVAAAAAGLAFHWLVIRRLRSASNLLRLVATLALLLVTQEAALLAFGSEARSVAPILPTRAVRILGAPIGEDRLWVLAIVVVLTTGLWALYRCTTFGLATSAVAENPSAAAALAISPELVAAANWTLGAALGGLAGILLVPITSLSTGNLSLIVVPVLAAAVVGDFVSFPATTIAGLAIGVAQSEVTRYVSQPGWDVAVPFIAVTALLCLKGRSVVGRAEAFGRMPSVGSGRGAPYPLAAAVVAVLTCIWVVLPFDWLVALQYQMLFAVLLMSVVLLTGYTGQISLAQMSMAGIGALVAAWLYSSVHLPFLLAASCAVAATAPVAAVIAFAGARTRGATLAIVTLGLAFSLDAVVFTNQSFTGGLDGYDTDAPTLFGLGVGGTEYPKRFATLTLVVLVGFGWALLNLRRGRAGRRLIAVRTNERAAAAMGISVAATKTYAFVVAGMMAAAGGVLFAFYQPRADFTGFGGLASASLTETAVLGGVGHVAGALNGSGFQAGTLPARVLSFLGNNVSIYLLLAASGLLLAFLPRVPDGVAALGLRRSSGPAGPAPRDVPVAAPPEGRAAGKALRLEGVTVTFGGTVAVRQLSLRVAPGRVVGLIGPNGAGKTTVLDAVTGFVEMSAGAIFLGEDDITAWPPARRARSGLARSFQSLELFEDLTVEENMKAAGDGRDRRSYVTDLVRPGDSRLTSRAAAAVADLGLQPDLRVPVRHLSYGQRRLLAVARAVAGAGAVLLLDEPAAGLGAADVATLAGNVRKLAHEWGLGVVLIEHNVDMVLRTCDEIVALNFGEVIARGNPSEIRSHPAVVEAYLGAAHPPGGSTAVQPSFAGQRQERVE